MSPPRTFQVIRDIPLPRAAVWHVLSHTERLNRQIGLSPVTYGDLQTDESGFYRMATSKTAGINLKWREYPFQWDIETRHSVVRVYDQGPIERFEGGIELEDGEVNHTKLRVFSHISARGAIGHLLVPKIANQFLDKTLKFCDEIFKDNPNPRPVAPAPRRKDVNEVLLEQLTDDIIRRGVMPRIAYILRDHLLNAGEDEVADLRPFEWASQVGIDRQDALKACLHGVKSGLFNLKWAMMCPNCRVSKNEATTLQKLESTVHCDLCGVTYDLNFDRYVELKFSIHPAVRNVSSGIYCIGGPFEARHILVQRRIEGFTSEEIRIPATGEELRLRVLRSNYSLDLVDGVPESSRLVVTKNGWSDGKSYIKNTAFPLTGHVTINNSMGEPIVVVVEKTVWDDMAASAAQVTALQEFRDMFSSEVLRPDRQVAVENSALFFSDLSNSTALYERIGDAPAFGRVGSHFDFLSEHIAANNGAVVKTMGDAVMAIFYKPEDAMQAALQIQRHFPYFRQTMSEVDEVDIKIGLHFGPVLAVNSNDRLDYFGRAVNIAARVVGYAEGGEIIMTSCIAEKDAVIDAVIAHAPKVTHFRSHLRGMQDEFDLYRICQ